MIAMATRTDLHLHTADSHDVIRVQGARENNLKDISIELPKRRLTVFTGVSLLLQEPHRRRQSRMPASRWMATQRCRLA